MRTLSRKRDSVYFFSITAGNWLGAGPVKGAGSGGASIVSHVSMHVGMQIGTRRHTFCTSQYASILHVVCGTHLIFGSGTTMHFCCVTILQCSWGIIRHVVYGMHWILVSGTRMHFLQHTILQCSSVIVRHVV